MPIKYGRRQTVTQNGEIISVTEEVYANAETVKSSTVMVESIHLKDENDAITEFLKLIDQQRSGKIDQVGIQLIRNAHNGSLRAEKTWVVV